MAQQRSDCQQISGTGAANRREGGSESPTNRQRISGECYIDFVTHIIPRNVAAHASEILSVFPALAIQGARQTGKSTLAAMLAADRAARQVTFDDQATLDLAREDPESFVAQVPGGMLVIDEVQRLPEISLAIKARIDRDRRPGQFILTGSSNLFASRGIQDSLAGRAVGIRLDGLSQGEHGHKVDDFVTSLVKLLQAGELPELTTELTRSDYAERITRGGYPEVRNLGERLRATWLQSYTERLLHRDALELSRINPDRLAALLRLFAANQAGELNRARLANEAALASSTVTDYLDLLRNLYLIDLLPPWTPNLTSREIGRPKVLVIDSGLAANLQMITTAGLADLTSTSFGGLLEGFVAAELLRQNTWSELQFRVYHYRDRNGLEVDLVIELADNRYVAIEVKGSASWSGRQFKSLKVLRDRLGDRLLMGIVLSTARNSYPFSDRLLGLPVSALWEL